jgi:hypothetical protein
MCSRQQASAEGFEPELDVLTSLRATGRVQILQLFTLLSLTDVFATASER